MTRKIFTVVFMFSLNWALVPSVSLAKELGNKTINKTKEAAYIKGKVTARYKIKVLKGHKETGLVDHWLGGLLKIQVLNEKGKPVPGIKVHFNIISAPENSKNTKLKGKIFVSDKDGFAQTKIFLGNKKGTYLIQVYTTGSPYPPVILSVRAQERGWFFFIIFGMAGGVAILLFGIEQMSRGMKNTAGEKMKAIIKKLTDNRIAGVLTGTFVTSIIQSSGATTVMLVSFVNAGLMKLPQTLGVILGADIGTTFTIQLIAFKITDYSLLLVAAGFIIMATAREKISFIGETILGLGLVFFGMEIMGKAVAPLRTFQPLLQLLANLENPVIGIMIGTLFTALIQSSSAFSGILLAMAMQGMLSLEAAIPLLLGANIGTCITAIIASLKANREAKRVAAAHTLFKVSGVILILFILPQFIDFIRWLTPGPDLIKGVNSSFDHSIPRQLANAHTLFNVGIAFLFLPFTPVLAAIVERMIPEIPVKRKKIDLIKIQYLDKALLENPSLALDRVSLEIINVAGKGKKSFRALTSLLIPFPKGKPKPTKERKIEEIKSTIEREEKIQVVYSEIIIYLQELNKRILGTYWSLTSIKFGMIVNELAHISKTTSMDLGKIFSKKVDSNLEFSKFGRMELRELSDLVYKSFDTVIRSFKERSIKLADKVIETDKNIEVFESASRLSHISRLSQGKEKSINTSDLHINLLESIKKISTYTRAIAIQIQIAESVRVARKKKTNRKIRDES